MAQHYRLMEIALEDAHVAEKKDREYGSSWKKRGGIGAFMMLARKWDRLENAMLSSGYDILRAIEEDRREEGIIDDIRDLRRYLMHVEDEAIRQGWIDPPSPSVSPAVDAIVDEECPRFPVHATDFEYRAEAIRLIRRGPMVGKRVADLYRKSQPGDSTVHPYAMHEMYREQYGKF